MNKHNRLILVDGSGYIFRAYYALPPMQKKDGTPVNAVFGFTNMLVKLIEDYYEDKIIVVFDAARENFRNSIFKDYKANRGETPEDLIPQFDLIRKCVDSFNLSQIEIEGYEADDIIASFAKLASSKNINSLIVSSDKDLMQLVNDNVTMLDPIKNKNIGIDEVKEKFGVYPEKVIYIQALTGDKVDNIPGAPGIGPKTALDLINQFSDIEELIKNAKEIKQEKKKNTIINSAEDIRLSLELVKLKNDIDLPLSISEIKTYEEIKKTNQEKLFNFLNENEFKKILERVKNNAYIVKQETQDIQVVEKKFNYKIIKTQKELESLIAQLIRKQTL